MRAMQCVQWGEPEQLELREIALPEPGPGQVRIRIAAAGVNFPDLLIVQKKYQMQPPLPFTPGAEVAGTVDAVGEGVTALRLGQAVAALCGIGGFAEAVVVDAALCMPLPAGVPMTLALLPLLSLLGFAALAIWPAYALLIFVQAGRRAINFAIASPTRELLYVPLPRGEKFKVKNFIDTFVFRAGDQIGALTQAGLNTVGAGIAATALLGLPLCAGWLALAFWLGRRHRQLTLDPIAPTPDVSATVPPSASGEAHATGSS
ncbi:MAG: alcohol dehydrogenase catalytic domain-containing protein [Xanthomonadales bacterium]|nr:alcohol dehydrogenase catalytic domain-containing protein [Xanthomonadales bacterium]